MFGNLGNIGGLLKQAKEVQERMATIQKEMLTRRFRGESGGGSVSVQVDGRGTLVSVKIQPDAAGDVELLEDLIVSAVRLASEQAQESSRQEMSRLTGGLNIPGLTDLLGGSK